MSTQLPTHSSWRSLLVLVCVVATVLIQGSPTTAQSSPRRFQMALFANPDSLSDADLTFFEAGQPQGAGRSIMRLGAYYDHSAEQFAAIFATQMEAYEYDVSRIEAVIVDEPYWQDTGGSDQSYHPCVSGDPRYEQVQITRNKLIAVSQFVKTYLPRAKFWVNFSEPEMHWQMGTTTCPLQLNDAAFDVVSMDKYFVGFDEGVAPNRIVDYIEWLRTHPAKSLQQIALVPGTFHTSDYGATGEEPAQVARLPAFFDYANARNADCSRGNCPVWVVAGFLGLNAGTWYGELDTSPAHSSTLIRNAWRAQLGNVHPNPPSISNISISRSSTSVIAGNPMTFTVTSSGGWGPTYYKYLINDGIEWKEMTGYSDLNTFVFTATVPKDYALCVYARNFHSTADYDTFSSYEYFTVSPITLTATANVSFPVVSQTPITWTAHVSSGTAVVELQYWICNSSGWHMMKDWSTGTTFTFTPISPGSYAFSVYARLQGSTSDGEAYSPTQPFTVVSP